MEVDQLPLPFDQTSPKAKAGHTKKKNVGDQLVKWDRDNQQAADLILENSGLDIGIMAEWARMIKGDR